MSAPNVGRRSSWAIAFGTLVAGIIIAFGPTGAVLDRALSPARFNLVQRAASGNIVIVEMDAKSTASIKRWPWSRTNYAEVVDRLRSAGAASIVFDVDFSSPSDSQGDQAFADALARADGTVALPTFGQQASSGEQRTIDALPIAAFRSHAALASVSISPDADGQVRAMPLGTMTAGTPRPSLSAFIAQRSGVADVEFPIDMSIDPASIPRLSFIDVRNGTFDPKEVRGRNILIGATAIEMGDRYATPTWGVIPGVTVQAIAAETLLRGLPVKGSTITVLLIAAVAVGLIVRMRSGTGIALSVMGVGGATIGAILFAQHQLLISYPLAPALCMIALAGIACGLRATSETILAQRMIDEATGLPNLHALQAAAKQDNAINRVVVLLDNYESLLAVLGPRLAGEVVTRVADRLMLVADEKRVFRTGERHLAFGLATTEIMEDIIDGLRAILLRPIEVAGRGVDVTIAIGVSLDHSLGANRQLADATLAAEKAVSEGLFWQRSASDDEALERSISLMGELDAALAAEQIEAFYQPKYNLREDRITSAEALVRWRHSERGFISPDVFIPLAEKTNRIAPLTLYILRRVVRDLQALRRQQSDLSVAVNISAKLLSSASFNREVEAILLSSSMPPTALIFEVTESAAMSDPSSAIAALQHYRDLGIAVSMDDYGTGQSTLTYLRQLPLSELKIDRSFVQHAHRNRDDSLLVRSTIELAHKLGLKVVAEGVEDGDCLGFLRSCGCDLVQGYLFSRPLPLSEFIQMLDEGTSLAA